MAFITYLLGILGGILMGKTFERNKNKTRNQNK
jgi:hypothetical protein